MAVSLASDMKIYDPRIQGGYREKIDYIIDLFNAGSNGTITLSTVSKAGHFSYEAFFARMSGIASRRDITSTADVIPIKATQSERVDVKLSRKIGPVDVTRDAMVKAGLSFGEDGAAFALGEWGAEAAAAERVDTAILAARAALLGQAAIKTSVWDNAVPAKLTNGLLITGTSKRGDKANEIACWVMHSKAYYDLVYAQVVTDKVTGIADVTMAGGSPASLGKPVIITDSPSLVQDPGGGQALKYYTLGLAPGAVTVEDTETEFITNQIITGGENLIYRLQGEYAYNLGILGQTWDVANGGPNPNGAAIGTSSNWDLVVTSPKSIGGVIIEHN